MNPAGAEVFAVNRAVTDAVVANRAVTDVVVANRVVTDVVVENRVVADVVAAKGVGAVAVAEPPPADGVVVAGWRAPVDSEQCLAERRPAAGRWIARVDQPPVPYFDAVQKTADWQDGPHLMALADYNMDGQQALCSFLNDFVHVDLKAETYHRHFLRMGYGLH